MTATVAFDFEDVLPTVQRAHSGANRDDAEDAVQTAVAELLAKGTPLTAPNVVTRARSRLISAKGRREARNASLDRFLEEDVDSAPVELAIEEVDFDAHVELSRASDNPVLAMRMATDRRVRWSRDLIVEAIRAFIREEGHRPGHHDLAHDPRLPVISVIERYFGSFPAALDAAGSSITEPTAGRPDGPVSWPKAKCEAAVRDWAAEHGRPPTYDDARHDRSLPHPSTVRNTYGGWLALRQAAGLPSTYENRRNTWPRDQALAALRGYLAEHGALPAVDGFAALGLPSRATLARVLGTSSATKLAVIIAYG